MQRRMRALLPLLLALLLLSACAPRAPQQMTRQNFLLDTLVEITLYDWEDPETLTRAMAEISRLEALLAVEREGSELDQLAKAAGRAWVDISPETEEVLRMAQQVYAYTQGHFDITTGPLIALWDVQNGGHLPSEEELSQTRPLLGSEYLQVEEGRAYLAKEGMIANLGAIAKGYIADQVEELLLSEGVAHAMINLGRNISLIGDKPDGSKFAVGVQNPLKEQGQLAETLYLTESSIVTAGIDERFFEQDGKRYHHILDPFTGFPAETGIASATIITEQSALADALSTSCVLLGPEEGMKLIDGLDGVEAIFLLQDGSRVESEGFAAYLHKK